MRPYQLWNDGPWIDLDHVQEVTPPEFIDRMGHGGFFVEMSIRFAFQDKPRVYCWQQEWTVPELKILGDGSVDEGFNDPRERVTLIEGIPDTLVRAELNIFRPLMHRWAGVRITGPVVPRGWK